MISQLKREALDALKGKWGLAVGATLLVGILIGAVEMLTTGIFSIFWGWEEASDSLTVSIIVMLVIGPLTVGASYFVLNVIRGTNARIGHIFRWFNDGSKFMKSFLTYLLMNVYLVLWTLLLIIPGIIKSFSYSMTYFILNDHPEYTANQAITESRRMMNGHKMDYFLLCLSFLGWFILSILTLGIGFLWLVPYFYTTSAAFYEEISKEYYKKENTTF
ncbi:DUF975 family protein [Bacillus wiedmannii]|uniref:DUF975 domain-containing protein n=1 Tax=Bacillus wiedmannii TaxID=1890302 RepID=A0A2B5WTG0_9BACI|nr:DUF975 family protein [Bacillus wiedmannii]PEL84708.1 hypothetical protein CN609_04640 [Bacillus wiedmannii]PEP26226.1 hypothetical protein CN566_19720 [Bacillus wiedmannii]PFZ44535.1 hypothetical protein COL77_09095 [Bacillus wiedmannii]PGA87031.1 hypothetical protein COL94_09325 [Bacillus wiedmannii]PGD62249.1 hypothetical protein COM41_20485 [Bacillus wiedmannii]